MLASDIREMSDADIRARIAELEEERFRLKFRSATETLEDPLRLRAVRKDIARLQTVLREKAVAGASGAAAPAATAARTGAAGKTAARKSAAKKGTAAKKTASAKRAATSAARR